MAINMFEGARRIAKLIAVLIVGLAMLSVSGCGEKAVPDDQVFTLYQNAPSTPSARVGVATFDMKWLDTEQMNHMRCNDIAELLQADWKLKTRDKPDLLEVKNFKYWCEKGRYKE